MEPKKLFQIQLAIIAVVGLLFLLGLFIEPYFFPYLMIPLLLVNIVFLFVNKTKGLFVNLLMIGCAFLLLLIFIDIIATFIGLLLSIYHFLRIGYVYNKKYVKKECCETKIKTVDITKKPKSKKSTKKKK